jgi:hypothetical protein
MKFFMPETFYNKRLRLGDNFYCPAGHDQHFTESTEKKLARAQAELSATRTKLQLEQDQHAATTAKMDKLKRRVKCGVCPCCKRSFANLRRHMEAKHKGFAG